MGLKFFVNISNDGWYGDTSAPLQHLNMARMRAIENNRWLLRDTNTGVTAVIDPYGRESLKHRAGSGPPCKARTTSNRRPRSTPATAIGSRLCVR